MKKSLFGSVIGVVLVSCAVLLIGSPGPVADAATVGPPLKMHDAGAELSGRSRSRSGLQLQVLRGGGVPHND